jgi:hypothetical protein
MERVPINAPQGPLGLIFEPESTVLSKVRETSPLYGRVEVGWTLVGVDREDVSHMDGSQVTKLLKMRSHNPQGRHLEFKKRSFSVRELPGDTAVEAPKPHVAVRADIEFRVGSMAWEAHDGRCPRRSRCTRRSWTCTPCSGRSTSWSRVSCSTSRAAWASTSPTC